MLVKLTTGRRMEDPRHLRQPGHRQQPFQVHGLQP